ncbi:MAG: hypothetical protein ABH870_00575 [bacterium]
MPILQIEQIYQDRKQIDEFDATVKQLKKDGIAFNISEDMKLFEHITPVQEEFEALDAVFGMLNDLTPEQMEVFDEAVKRRPLF